MTRHKVVVVLDLADDDQSDEETIREIVEHWVCAGVREGNTNTGIDWPPAGPNPEDKDNDVWNVSVEIPHGWRARTIRKVGVDA